MIICYPKDLEIFQNQNKGYLNCKFQPKSLYLILLTKGLKWLALIKLLNLVIKILILYNKNTELQ